MLRDTRAMNKTATEFVAPEHVVRDEMVLHAAAARHRSCGHFRVYAADVLRDREPANPKWW